MWNWQLTKGRITILAFSPPCNLSKPLCGNNRKHNSDTTNPRRCETMTQRQPLLGNEQHANYARMAHRHSYSKHNPGHNQEADEEMSGGMDEICVGRWFYAVAVFKRGTTIYFLSQTETQRDDGRNQTLGILAKAGIPKHHAVFFLFQKKAKWCMVIVSFNISDICIFRNSCSH